MDWLQKRSLREKYKRDLDFTPHSVHHQIVSSEYDSVRDDYNEMIIQFGYLMFFSVVAPLTPLICLVLTYLEKFVDTYKLFYLERVTIINGANGIGIYNYLFKIWYFIGMTTNIGLILFTNFPDSTGHAWRYAVFLVVENAILIIMFFTNWNILPTWYENKNLIPTLYSKQYFNKEFEALPHHLLYDKYLK